MEMKNHAANEERDGETGRRKETDKVVSREVR